MSAENTEGVFWSEDEIDLIVVDYFDMLAAELSGKPYVKSHRNQALQELTGRSKGSIEFKHQNISAILYELGEPWIQGYKPMKNYQKDLAAGIERYLETRKEFHADLPQLASVGLAESPQLYFEAPPVLRKQEDHRPEFLRRMVQKFDPAARDARNRILGKQGEELVFKSERSRLITSGRDDLARKVRWVAQEDGDGAGYDILSFDDRGRERLLEVKTTTGHQTTPFYITENERGLSAERPADFRLLRVFDFARSPRAFELRPPLEDALLLSPTTYRAQFG